ncbi:uncharacterized protein LOC131655669 isoform X2 [Vicia villosa]|uniref:uncharacterized protein LOC131655669 isoform X2 n=1 Tax=Vicia villosa TaxID=3911 RepID=UPI00273C1488|nr:uncharacterized protein LOC131655669 isoform X2 [Vicia villosa]
MNNQVEEKKNNVEAEKPKPTAGPSNLERTSSIDNEPKTLLQEELNLAREQAWGVISTHPKEEALKIFLKPVTCSKQPSSEDGVVYDDSDDDTVYNYSDEDFVYDAEDENEDDDE